jgi:hypothetical protein
VKRLVTVVVLGEGSTMQPRPGVAASLVDDQGCTIAAHGARKGVRPQIPLCDAW